MLNPRASRAEPAHAPGRQPSGGRSDQQQVASGGSVWTPVFAAPARDLRAGTLDKQVHRIGDGWPSADHDAQNAQPGRHW